MHFLLSESPFEADWSILSQVFAHPSNFRQHWWGKNVLSCWKTRSYTGLECLGKSSNALSKSRKFFSKSRKFFKKYGKFIRKSRKIFSKSRMFFSSKSRKFFRKSRKILQQIQIFFLRKSRKFFGVEWKMEKNVVRQKCLQGQLGIDFFLIVFFNNSRKFFRKSRKFFSK